MSRSILTSIYLFFSCAIFSQNSSSPDSLLTGSWQETGYEMGGKFYPQFGSSTVLSFYPDHVYQLERAFPKPDTMKSNPVKTTVEAGNWQISADGSYVDYTMVHVIGFPNQSAPDSKNWITSIDDTSLVLGVYEGKTLLYFRYKKTATKTKLPDDYDPEEVPPPTVVNRYFLVNTFDKTKRIEIKHYENPDFYIQRNKNDTTLDEETHYFSGSVISANSSAVTIGASYESIYRYYKNGGTFSMSRDYDSDTAMSFPIQSLTSISYRGPARAKWNAFGAGIIYCSFLDLLFVAPLASIKYRHGNGGFNTQRYFNLTGIGLAGLTIGIPIAIGTQKKTYQLSQGLYVDSKHWFIE